MEIPKTTYAKTEDGYLAYQVVGAGPELLFITNPIHNIDVMWEQPSISRFFGRLAAFGRLISYNPRGTGVSSPLPSGASLQEWMDDARRILDALAVERAALIGDTEGGPTAMLFAATYPDRVSALVLVNTFARFLRDTDYPYGVPDRTLPGLIESFELMYGTGAMTEILAPSSAGDARFREWFGRYQRLSMAGPGVAGAGYRAFLLDLDVRSILPTIRVPTLVLHRVDNPFVRVGHGRHLAQAIPGATYVELSGGDALYYAGNADEISDEIRLFLTGVREVPESDRILATILFTDVVDSTSQAAELGDRRWRELLDAHDEASRRLVEHFRGRVVKTTGDGVLATFDGPARAIRCARGMIANVRGLGMEVRTGLHTGEVELRGEDVGGIAVNLAARVMAEAGAGETLVSSTVKDLVVGSDLEFDDRGAHALKGVPGEWRLYAVKP